jgi:hypothetical protein
LIRSARHLPALFLLGQPPLVASLFSPAGLCLMAK